MEIPKHDALLRPGSERPRYDRLDKVDRLIDWTRLNRYLRWLETDCEQRFGFPALTLFKALLLKQWFTLRADEFDFDMADRSSFRRFIGLGPTDRAPCYTVVTTFAGLILERSVAVELFEDLKCQFQRGRPGANAEALHGLKGAAALGPLFTFGAEVPSPEWQAIENAFLDFWHGARGDEDAPTVATLSPTALPQYASHGVLFDVFGDGDDFAYAYFGSELEKTNGATLVGQRLTDKATYNIDRYGHPGIQGEILSLLRNCLTTMRPAKVTGYFRNARLQKCQVWMLAAPVLDPQGSRVVKLIGAGLITTVSIN